jgi:hypothetical protein
MASGRSRGILLAVGAAFAFATSACAQTLLPSLSELSSGQTGEYLGYMLYLVELMEPEYLAPCM